MLEPLRHFVLVAQHRTFTAAARHAGVTQPALTTSIQRLEAQMEARLFVRGPAGASLTAAGEALLPRARAALAAVDDGRRAVAEVMGLAVGSVRFGAGATVCTYYLPRLLARFRAKHPGVQILLREAPQDELLAALENGELDLAILPRVKGLPVPRDWLRTARGSLVREKWLDDELVLVAAPKTDPSSAPLVTFPRGTNTRALVDRSFPAVPIAMELSSIAAVKGHVRAGVGIALVSRRAVERDVASGQLVVLRDARTPLSRSLYLVHRGRERLPPAAAELFRLLHDHSKRRPRATLDSAG